MYVMKLKNELTQDVLDIPIPDYDGVTDYTWLAYDLASSNGFAHAYTFTIEEI